LHDRDVTQIPPLADALRRDAARDCGDEDLAAVKDAVTPSEREGVYPQLTRAAADLANGHGDERAIYVSRTIIRPLSESFSGAG
jgi:hypothetical protein